MKKSTSLTHTWIFSEDGPKHENLFEKMLQTHYGVAIPHLVYFFNTYTSKKAVLSVSFCLKWTFWNTLFCGTNFQRCRQCNVFYVTRIFRFSISYLSLAKTSFFSQQKVENFFLNFLAKQIEPIVYQGQPTFEWLEVLFEVDRSRSSAFISRETFLFGANLGKIR